MIPDRRDGTVMERQPQDEFLILTSGGLWDAVAPAPSCGRGWGDLTDHHGTGDTPVDAMGSPDVLANKAVHAGSKDNVSVVIVMFRDFWAQKDGGKVSSSALAI